MSTFVLRTNCYRSYKRLYSLLALVPEVKERFKSLPQAIFIPVARLRLIYELFIYLFIANCLQCFRVLQLRHVNAKARDAQTTILTQLHPANFLYTPKPQPTLMTYKSGNEQRRLRYTTTTSRNSFCSRYTHVRFILNTDLAVVSVGKEI